MRLRPIVTLVVLTALLWSGQALAATYNVSGTGGGTCGSGSLGPNSGNLTIQAGEAVTINFSVSEPTYPAGWDFTSTLWGTVHANSGDSVSASFNAPITAGNYTYQATWPSNACLKASANITVTAAPASPTAPPPPPPPAATPTPPPAPAAAPAPAETDTSKLNLDTSNTADQSATGSSLLDSNGNPTKPVTTATKAANSNHNAVLIGLAILGLGLVGGLGFWAWRLAGKL